MNVQTFNLNPVYNFGQWAIINNSYVAKLSGQCRLRRTVRGNLIPFLGVKEAADKWTGFSEAHYIHPSWVAMTANQVRTFHTLEVALETWASIMQLKARLNT